MSIKIKDRVFKYGGLKYYRAAAHEINLGSYGKKKVPFGKTGHLEVAGRIRPRHLADEPIKVAKVAIDWDRVSEADIGVTGGLTYQGVGINVSHAFTLSRARSARLQLVSFSIAENPLERVLNTEANFVRREMEDEGGDARVVSEVWIAMEAELASDFRTGTMNSADVDYQGASLQVSVGTNNQNRSRVTLEPGTTFAYRLSRVRRWNNDRTRITDMAIDHPG